MDLGAEGAAGAREHDHVRGRGRRGRRGRSVGRVVIGGGGTGGRAVVGGGAAHHGDRRPSSDASPAPREGGAHGQPSFPDSGLMKPNRIRFRPLAWT